MRQVPATHRRGLVLSIAVAGVVSALLFSGVAFTTYRYATGNLLTLFLHYPLFLLCAWLPVARLSRRIQLVLLTVSLPLVTVIFIAL